MWMLTFLYSSGLVAAILIALTWLGYPLAMLARASRASGSCAGVAPPASAPAVTAVIATRESPEVVRRRVLNLLNNGYGGALQVVVAVDTTSTYAPDRYSSEKSDWIVVQGDIPGGKAATLNAGVRAAAHSYLVFTDSYQEFLPGAIGELVQVLGIGQTGAVSGNLEIERGSARSSLLGFFWRYERWIRRLEVDNGGLVAVTGAIYALKKSLWTPLPSGLICDDLFVPLHVAKTGHRVALAERSLAFDPRTFSKAQEFRRKVRTLTGMIQICLLQPTVLVPWLNPIWTQLMCHKIARLLTPLLVAVVAIAATTWIVVEAGKYWPLLIGASSCLMAILLVAARRPTLRAIKAGAWATTLLAAPIVAMVRAARGNWNVW